MGRFPAGQQTSARARAFASVVLVVDLPLLRANCAGGRAASGDLAIARALTQESIDMCRDLGVRTGFLNSLIRLGQLIRGQGDYSAARSVFEAG